SLTSACGERKELSLTSACGERKELSLTSACGGGEGSDLLGHYTWSPVAVVLVGVIQHLLTSKKPLGTTAPLCGTLLFALYHYTTYPNCSKRRIRQTAEPQSEVVLPPQSIYLPLERYCSRLRASLCAGRTL